jgi:GH43 family beta-xylosidase
MRPGREKTGLLTSVSDWNTAESRTLFAPAPGLNYSTDIWAPELHNLNDAWYIIFTADPRNDSPPPEVDM